MAEIRLGIDIGGTGIKGALVDLDLGELVSERVRVPTPKPSPPESVVEAVSRVVSKLEYEGPIGIGFPAIVLDGVAWSANNIDPAWIGVNARSLFQSAIGTDITMVNDADAAALCEARYGAAHGIDGSVLVVTFGTGIGSGLLHDGRLVPNLEVGMLELDGYWPAEIHFSAAAKENEDLSWEEWLVRVNRFLSHVKLLFSPKRIVVGGGLTKHWEEWSGLLDPALGAVRAARANNAGIIGAATLVG